MPVEILWGVTGSLFVIGVYFWFVRRPNETEKT